MKLIKAAIILVVGYLLVLNFPLIFIYKDAVFCKDVSKKLSGKLVYDSSGEAKGTIVILDLAAGKKTIIPREIVGYAQSPSFSPDGKRIIFSGRKDVLYMINIDGTELGEFFNFRTTGNYINWVEAPGAYVPSWSPDGTKVAFVSESGLFITEINQPYAYRCILKMPLAKNQPAWSPDSKQLAVVTAKWEYCRTNALHTELSAQRFAGKILIVNADGSECKELVDGASPAWSPGGREIAFRAEGSYCVVDISVPRKRRLISSTKSIIQAGVSVPPRWSPDGQYITVGKKLWFYTDGIYAVSINDPQKRLWIDASGENIWGMSWVD